MYAQGEHPVVSITVNGNLERFEHEPTVEEVLARLNAPRAAVAVEVNRTIVPRRSHARHVLKSGDQVEVVTFVGGG